MQHKLSAVLALMFGVFIHYSALSSPRLEMKFPTLEDRIIQDPQQDVEVVLKFSRIIRAPQLVELINSSHVELTKISFKFVGSGGGTMQITPRSGSQNLAQSLKIMQKNHRNMQLTMLLRRRTGERMLTPPLINFADPINDPGRVTNINPAINHRQGLTAIGLTSNLRHGAAQQVTQAMLDEIELPPCDLDDALAPVHDTHGIPGKPEIEAACGLRINGITVRGRAIRVQHFIDTVEYLEQSSLVPTREEILAIRQTYIEALKSK